MIRLRAAEIASEIQLTRSHHQGSFLIVEGRDDRLFMEAFTSRNTCQIFVARDKQAVLESISVLDGIGFRGALGLVDADFDRVSGVKHTSANIVSYDCHDLESMLIFSPALERVLIEFGSRSKISGRGGNVLSLLVGRAMCIGYLRLHSMLGQHGFRFQGIRCSSWIDRSSFNWSFDELVKAVDNNTTGQSLDAGQLRRNVDTLAGAKYDSREVCVGSDLVDILSLGLRSALGSNNAGVVSGETLRRSLRLGYSIGSLLKSDVGRGIRQWEGNNRPFRVIEM